MPSRKSAQGLKTAKAGTDYSVGNLPPGTIRMDLNTNLLGPNPAITRFLKAGKFETHQYPSPHADLLREALAKEWRIRPDNIVCSNGVDDIINLTIKAFTERGDSVAFPVPSFTMYNFWTRTYGAIPVEVPMLPGFTIDVDGLLKKTSKLMIVARPNNPTGNMMPQEDLYRLIEGTKGYVALDEAYIEYSGGSFMDRLKRYPNLVIYRTFSKAYAIAGMRVGVAAATDGMKRLMAVKPPFNLNVVSEAAALIALNSKAWLKKSVVTIVKERPKVARALGSFGFVVYPSVTNFLLCKAPIPSKEVCEGLAKRGILIKDFGNVPGLEEHVRITIGAPKHNRVLIENLRIVLENKGVKAP